MCVQHVTPLQDLVQNDPVEIPAGPRPRLQRLWNTPPDGNTLPGYGNHLHIMGFPPVTATFAPET
jgi:hypothetical protein